MENLKNSEGESDFQADYVTDLARESNYGYDLDVREICHQVAKLKRRDITTYRDQSFTSKFTGTKSLVHHTPFMEAFDDSMQTFLNTKQ